MVPSSMEITRRDSTVSDPTWLWHFSPQLLGMLPYSVGSSHCLFHQTPKKETFSYIAMALNPIGLLIATRAAATSCSNSSRKPADATSCAVVPGTVRLPSPAARLPGNAADAPGQRRAIDPESASGGGFSVSAGEAWLDNRTAALETACIDTIGS